MPELYMDGEAMSRHEPEVDTRSGYVRFHEHPKTSAGKTAWRTVWMTQGRPRVVGAFWLQIQVEVTRPRAHFLKDGSSLSAAGKRSPRPTVKPDLDNVTKLVLDALKQLAFGDDKDLVWLHIDKVWSKRDRVTMNFDRWLDSAPALARSSTNEDPSVAA